MLHLPWLLERTNGPGGEPCGHALMASCPPGPLPTLSDKGVPFGDGQINPGHEQTWKPSKGDLATLLDLSRRLDLDGEITPIVSKFSEPRAAFQAPLFVRLGFLNTHVTWVPECLSNRIPGFPTNDRQLTDS